MYAKENESSGGARPSGAGVRSSHWTRSVRCSHNVRRLPPGRHAADRKHLREESTMTEQQRTTGGELKVLTSNSMRGVMVPIAEQFEKTSGYKLAVSYDPAKAMLRRIAAGESADVAILGKPAIDTLTIEGKIDGDSRRTLA